MVDHATAAPAGTEPRLLSVVIPAYNEESVIGGTLRALAARLQEIDFELLVVDDGSSDRTKETLIDLKRTLPQLRHINNPGPHGYGYAVRYGLASYRGDAVAIVMADGS